MKPRCQGAKTPGHFTSFECVLDEGHSGFCRPYCAPDVDEWRALQLLLTSAEEDARLYAGRTVRIEEACRADVARLQALADTRWTTCADMSRDVARLQAENDALRAILASGCDACAHGTPRV